MPLAVPRTDQRVKDSRKELADISSFKWYGLWGAGHYMKPISNQQLSIKFDQEH